MKSSKTGLFLMELIISILFFALSSTVCIQLFAKSHLLDVETSSQNTAVVKCENLCEIYSGIVSEYPDDSEREAVLFDFIKASSMGSDENLGASIYHTFYDSDWAVCDKGGSAFLVEFRDYGLDEQANVYKGEAFVYSMTDGDFETRQLIYSLPVSKHLANILN